MLENYVRNGKIITATLDNGKEIKMMSEFIDKMMNNLGIDEEEAVLTWLEDEEYIMNEDQEELDEIAKANKSHKIVKADTAAKKKTPRERVVKENPTKEAVIAEIAKTIEAMNGVTNVIIENKAKIITFNLDGNDYKIDLIQKRKPKA